MNKINWSKPHWENPDDEDDELSEAESSSSDEQQPYNDTKERDSIEVRHVEQSAQMLQALEDMSQRDQFNCWLAETNFPISEASLMILNAIPGVEKINVTTKYRFLVAVGRLFNENDVKYDIGYALGCFKNSVNIFPRNVVNKVEELHKKFVEYPYWAIYVFPNGRVFSICKETYKYTDFRKLCKSLDDLHSKVGGYLTTSKDVVKERSSS